LESFTERVIQIIQQIPSGKVMTYGQIARLAGSPRGARQVVRILHSMSDKYKLPWHRVINAKGEIGLKAEELFFNQKMSLESEGIQFTNQNSINLEIYQYHPESPQEK
jgi:methylated-DNA-protein-cysteine methyltransferase related protein